MAHRVSKAQQVANRVNAERSTGPSNTVSTRFNAVKHGLLAEGITELDDVGYTGFLAGVKTALKPEGTIQHFLSERICLCMVRLKRASRLEAEFITGTLNPPITKIEGRMLSDTSELLNGKTVVVDPGLPAPLPESAVEHLVGRFQRYETAIENKLYRAMNQLERLQRLRLGEKLPAPATLDMGVHLDQEPLASFGNYENTAAN